MRERVLVGLGAGLALLVLWQGWSQWRLAQRVDALEAELQEAWSQREGRQAAEDETLPERTPRPLGLTAPASPHPGRVIVQDATGSGTPPATSVEALREVVGDELERQAQVRMRQKAEVRVATVTSHYEAEVSSLAAEYGLGPEAEEALLSILVDSIWQGVELREQVAAGELTVAEAKALGAEIKLQTSAAIEEVVGAEAADALWEALGKG